MNNNISFLLLFMFQNYMFSQGGWNIKYYPIQELNTSYIGQQIFLDLKENDTDIIDHTVSFSETRQLLANNREHEIDIVISGTITTFKEDWRIYVDAGFLQDQVLINEENELLIKDIFLIAVNNSTISLEANLDTSNNTSSIQFEVPRDKVKGFLTIID